MDIYRDVLRSTGVLGSKWQNFPQHQDFIATLLASTEFHGVEHGLNNEQTVYILEECANSPEKARLSVLVLADKLKTSHNGDSLLLTLDLVECFVKNLGLSYAKNLNQRFMDAFCRLLRLTTLSNSVSSHVKKKINSTLGLQSTNPGVATDPKIHKIKRKVLFLLQLWHDNFLNEWSELTPLFNTYKSLRNKGVVFPTIPVRDQYIIASKNESAPSGDGEASPTSEKSTLSSSQLRSVQKAISHLQKGQYATLTQKNRLISICKTGRQRATLLIERLSATDASMTKHELDVASLLELCSSIDDVLASLKNNDEAPMPEPLLPVASGSKIILKKASPSGKHYVDKGSSNLTTSRLASTSKRLDVTNVFEDNPFSTPIPALAPPPSGNSSIRTIPPPPGDLLATKDTSFDLLFKDLAPSLPTTAETMLSSSVDLWDSFSLPSQASPTQPSLALDDLSALKKDEKKNNKDFALHAVFPTTTTSFEVSEKKDAFALPTSAAPSPNFDAFASLLPPPTSQPSPVWSGPEPTRFGLSPDVSLSLKNTTISSPGLPFLEEIDPFANVTPSLSDSQDLKKTPLLGLESAFLTSMDASTSPSISLFSPMPSPSVVSFAAFSDEKTTSQGGSITGATFGSFVTAFADASLSSIFPTETHSAETSTTAETLDPFGIFAPSNPAETHEPLDFSFEKLSATADSVSTDTFAHFPAFEDAKSSLDGVNFTGMLSVKEKDDAASSNAGVKETKVSTPTPTGMISLTEDPFAEFAPPLPPPPKPWMPVELSSSLDISAFVNAPSPTENLTLPFSSTSPQGVESSMSPALTAAANSPPVSPVIASLSFPTVPSLVSSPSPVVVPRSSPTSPVIIPSLSSPSPPVIESPATSFSPVVSPVKEEIVFSSPLLVKTQETFPLDFRDIPTLSSSDGFMPAPSSSFFGESTEFGLPASAAWGEFSSFSGASFDSHLGAYAHVDTPLTGGSVPTPLKKAPPPINTVPKTAVTKKKETLFSGSSALDIPFSADFGVIPGVTNEDITFLNEGGGGLDHSGAFLDGEGTTGDFGDFDSGLEFQKV